MGNRVVVLGGGFGGLQAVIELERKLPPEDEVILVSEQNYLLFTPLLPQIASSAINPRHIVQTIRDIRGRRRFSFRRDTVQGIDTELRRVNLVGESLEYDALVVALGGRSDDYGIPGVTEHSWDFKSLEDAVVLRDHIIDLCEHADHTPDAALRRALLTFMVVGGGYTGVELAAELSDFLYGYAARKYRGISPAEIRLLLLEASPEILRGTPEKLRQHAIKRLDVRSVELQISAAVTRVGDDRIEINGSEVIRTATIIWTAGVRANWLVEALPGPHDRAGRAVVNQFLQLEGHPEVFVIGDAAATTPPPPAPQVAPVAMATAETAAGNVANFLERKPLETYSYKNEGMLISLGMNYAVVNVRGIQFSGYIAWLFWNAVHLYKLVGFKKQIQVAMDWALGTIFPRDAAIVRRPKRCKLCGHGADVT